MSWITTASGQDLDLAMPRPGQINIKDIAHSLAQINRFTGHAGRPYSVAEHSLLVCDIATDNLQLDVHGQLAALLHDAHEAYCGDLHTPGKQLVGQAWYAFERNLERSVHSAFAINSASRAHHDAIKRADLMALAIEHRDLMFKTARAWPILSGVVCIPTIRLDSVFRSKHMQWQDWRDEFLQRYHELDYARNQDLFGCSRHDATPSTPAIFEAL
jgi:hypothetical protein